MNSVKRGEMVAIFDRDGGITLKLGCFAHTYGHPEQAADDWLYFEINGDTRGCLSHEDQAAALSPSPEQIGRGEYRVYDAAEIDEEVSNQSSTGWLNIDEFCLALKELEIRP